LIPESFSLSPGIRITLEAFNLSDRINAETF
jgi:hypothetical protein